MKVCAASSPTSRRSPGSAAIVRNPARLSRSQPPPLVRSSSSRVAAGRLVAADPRDVESRPEEERRPWRRTRPQCWSRRAAARRAPARRTSRRCRSCSSSRSPPSAAAACARGRAAARPARERRASPRPSRPPQARRRRATARPAATATAIGAIAAARARSETIITRFARVTVAEDARGRGDRGGRQPADEAEQADREGAVLLVGEDGQSDVVRPRRRGSSRPRRTGAAASPGSRRRPGALRATCRDRQETAG